MFFSYAKSSASLEVKPYLRTQFGWLGLSHNPEAVIDQYESLMER